MRYEPGQLPEIIDAYSRDELYFASIRLCRQGEDRVFELGISRTGYAALRRILQTRPFDVMPGLKYRYYFVPTYSGSDDPERCSGGVRIELGSQGKESMFEMPKSLLANLLWFWEMKSLESAAHLQSWPPEPSDSNEFESKNS